MNKKLAFGISAFCAASAFMACGDGSIVSTDASDKLAKASAQTDLTELDTNDIRTYMSMAGIPTDENTFGSATSAPTSSAAVPTSSAPAATSSASTPLGGLSSPSGSLTGPTGGLSAAAPESSSAGAVDPIVTPGDASKGSCKPSKPAVELNEAVTWTYEPPEGTAVSVLMGLAAKDFRWTFTDGTPDAVAKKGMTSDPVAYAKSGEKTATVFFDYLTGVEESVSCKVDVKGIPVTGCKCTATAAEVDLAGGASVAASWKIEGCLSDDPTYSYFWNGTAGEETFSTTATARGEVAGPTAYVKNSDNGMQEGITCPVVKVTDSVNPLYKLSFADQDLTPKILDSIPNKACISLEGTWTNAGWTSAPLNVSCDLAGNVGAATLKLTYGDATPVTGSGTNSLNNVKIAILPNMTEVAGKTPWKAPSEVCVEYSGADFAKCVIAMY